jgi:biopolymer transport protein ExbD
MPHRRRPIFALADDPAPISAVNTTPLIDVLLVLLIMFILTVPVATHKVRIDLPSNAPPVAETPQVHELALDAGGRPSWDGVPFAEAGLPARLAAMRAAEPDALLRLRADGHAPYAAFDRMLATVKRSGVDRLAFVGNESFLGALR